MDFDDLLVRSVNLLELSQESGPRHLALPPGDGRRVPGHQPRPVPLAQLLASSTAICVVGDDAQSIYGFRGADIRNILDFQDHYPDAR